MEDIILKMRSISKAFPGVQALSDVDFDLRTGEVHALMGENGAGKSTLMKCLAGIYPADSGEITFQGQEVTIREVPDSMALGISFIHQELVLADQLTVAENIFMGREPKLKSGFVDRKKMHEESQRLIDSLDGKFSCYIHANMLSTAQKQVVEIARALSINAKVIVMDEPTAALTQREVDKLFELIANLKKKNISVVYISHRMEEIFQIADRITVLRDGKLIRTLDVKETDNAQLIQYMVGHSLNEYYVRSEKEIGEVILEAKNLTRADRKVEDASFCLKKGEILGFAGLVGAGRTELMQMLFGVERPVRGTITLEGKEIRIHNTRDALRHGIGLVPEDRKLQGLILNNTVKFNLTIGILDQFIHFINVNKKKEDQFVKEYAEMLSIKIASPLQKVVNLSGGNQQKVVLSKWLATSSGVLILDEPTRGIDVGAKADIYAIMDRLSKEGISIIMVSSEMPELINMCDRIYVMHEGRIAACMGRDELDQEKILRYALGVEEDERKDA